MNFKLLNNITGWLIFFIATLVYVLTLEPTSSFWDCGEFISCANKLMTPHPPGAPFFLLVGRVFSMFADPQNAAYWVNMVSAVSSGFASLFLFWSITLLAKKVVVLDKEISLGQSLLIIGAGIVGSLAYTFTDSAWFSAVEAEVYAMSSFFTAFVFWAILKWEAHSEESDSDKWLILIAYMMGLSIGVHLLNLVAIPALCFVVYFKKFKPEGKGIVLTFLLSIVILGVVMIGIITGLPNIAKKLDISFVNGMGMSFGSGIIFFSLLVLAALGGGIYYSIKHSKRILNTALLCVAFIIIGYSSYGVLIIRTAFDPTIDMNDPDDIVSFIDYLERKQYGDRPLLLGPYFTAEGNYKVNKNKPTYYKGDKKYEKGSPEGDMVYRDKDKTLFPRAYSTQSHHIRAYRNWMDLPKGRPTFFHNMKYFIKYQIGHMYFRYFMWNFAGRKSDFQDSGWMGPWDWADDDVPYLVETNKARNNYYLLPLIAGVLGMVYHFRRNLQDASVVTMLFFFTGIAIIIYLNQPPVEPRERDYTFAGSFWAFSIWIGMAVLFLADALQKIIKSETIRPVIATLLCLAVPGILASENWDDHDRSQRYHQVDAAKNLLESCAPNAVLFTGGDNDTYPLWYVQEVEGFRTDVRVCNLSLLDTDWYINQMKRQAGKSAPLPISLEMENYRQGVNDQGYFGEDKNTIKLKQFIRLVKENDSRVIRQMESGPLVFIPSNKLQLDIDKEKVLKHNPIPAKLKDSVLTKLEWSMPGRMMLKKNIIMLDMLVNNNWERPIYFASSVSPNEMMGLSQYMQVEGLAYRLLPVKNGRQWYNTDIMYKNMMEKFQWRNTDNPDVYYNEWYYLFTSPERQQFGELAQQLILEGKKDSAAKVLKFSLKVLPDKSIPFDNSVAEYVPILYSLNEKKLADEIINLMGPRLQKSLEYAVKIGDLQELHKNYMIAREFSFALRDQERAKEALQYTDLMQKYEPILEEMYQGIR